MSTTRRAFLAGLASTTALVAVPMPVDVSNVTAVSTVLPEPPSMLLWEILRMVGAWPSSIPATSGSTQSNGPLA